MHRRLLVVASLVLVSSLPSTARADRRYFVQSYTPYVAPAGNLELEVAANGSSGLGDSLGTSWANRVEFEYGITDRLTGAAYMNFVQSAGLDQPSSFDGPSFELIYQLAQPGRLPVDPAAYLEVRANGNELEVEPKLLLARRIYKLVGVVNVIGEFERVHEGGATETEKALEVTSGFSREIGHVFAIGVEAKYARTFADQGSDPWSVLLGPTINLQTPKIQLALGWHPQISGHPAGSGGLNLADYPRSEVRLLVGVEL